MTDIFDPSEEEVTEYEDPQDVITRLMNENVELEKARNGILNDLRSTRTELSTLRGRFDQIADQWSHFFATHDEKPLEQEEEPEDPFDKLDYRRAKDTEKIKQELTKTQQQFQKQNQQFALQQTIGLAKQLESAFANEVEDYQDAYNYAKNYYLNHFKNTYGLDDFQAQQLLGQEELNFVLSAVQSGQNPAAVVYNMAKQFGYQKKEAEEESEDTSEAFDLELEEPKPKARPKQPKGPISLSNVPGKTKRRFNIETILETDKEEFNRIVTEDPAKWEKIMRKLEGSEGVNL